MPKSKCSSIAMAYGSAKKKATGGVVKMKKGGEAKKTKNLGDKSRKVWQYSDKYFNWHGF